MPELRGHTFPMPTHSAERQAEREAAVARRRQLDRAFMGLLIRGRSVAQQLRDEAAGQVAFQRTFPRDPVTQAARDAAAGSPPPLQATTDAERLERARFLSDLQQGRVEALLRRGALDDLIPGLSQTFPPPEEPPE